MAPFLQVFYAEELFVEVRDDVVTRRILNAAIEIAMLGMVDECGAICNLLADHNQLEADKADFGLQCFWTYSDSQPPPIKDDSDGAVWVLSKEEIQQKQHGAWKAFSYPFQWLDWDSIDSSALEQMHAAVNEALEKQHASATTGSDAWLASTASASLIGIASDLNRSDVIADMMPIMAQRHRANCQMQYLGLIPVLWKDYFLTGWLREQLSITKEAVEQYAAHILDTARQRFEQGPRRPDKIYSGLTMKQLVEIIDENTVSDPEYMEYLEMMKPEAGTSKTSDKENAHTQTIMHVGATAQQILAAEERIGRTLPDDLKEFFKICNGCESVRVGEGLFIPLLPLSLDTLFFEKKDYMDDYGFEIVPKLFSHLDIELPETMEGGIAIYEHDGQGTRYVWALGAEDIKKSKEKLQTAYDQATADDKALIDRYIKYWYGSREAYDAMTDLCYYVVGWGEGAEGVYTNYKSFLADIAHQSQHRVDPSPLPNSQNK